MKLFKASVLAALLTFPVTANAGPNEDLVAGMGKCAAITDNTSRLACYDSLAPQLKAAQQQPAPPPVDNRAWYDPSRIFGTSPAQQTRPEQFGAENLPAPPPPPPKPGEAPPPPEPEALDSITGKVTDYAYNPYGRFIVFLENGQIWRQIEADTDEAHFHKGGGDTVTISRGALGSYNLRINDSGISFKVRRVK